MEAILEKEGMLIHAGGAGFVHQFKATFISKY